MHLRCDGYETFRRGARGPIAARACRPPSSRINVQDLQFDEDHVDLHFDLDTDEALLRSELHETGIAVVATELLSVYM